MPTIGQLADALGGQIHGDPELVVRDAQALDKAGQNDITFVADESNLRKLPSSQAGAVIVGIDHADSVRAMNLGAVLLIVDDPQSAFIEVLEILRPQRPRPEIGISAQALVSPSARIGDRTNVYPGVWIGEGVVVGEDCDLHPGVCIGPGCQIGDDVTLFPHVVVYADITIGDRVQIHASTVIGADGFGYRMVDGHHQKILHFGTVRIENDVEIGACATIDRAMIGETVVGTGTKIDNHVMIAHNCELGRHNLIVSQVAFAGSVTSGDYVIVAGQAGVVNQVHLGDRCVIGSKSGVTKDVPSGATYVGVPALPVAVTMKIAITQRKIPEMRKTLQQLAAQVAQLTTRMDAMSEDKQTTSKSAA
jgi:UDP-3-O-[3-hydroxymyristoyl] glucosamine N-acyltransferase